MASISLSRAFDEANAFLRREAGLLTPVALALIVLPTVLLDQLRPSVPPSTAEGAVQGFQPAMLANPIGLLLTLYASLVITLLALRPGVSVGEAFRLGGRRLVVAIGASALLGIAFALLLLPVLPIVLGGEAAVQRMQTGIALLLLLYLVAISVGLLVALVRLLPLNTVAAIEPLGVVATVARSWKLTQGLFWRLFGLVVLFLVASLIAGLAVVAAGGTVLLGLGRLLGDPDLGRLLLGILAAGVNAAFLTWLYVMLACIYRQLVPSSSGI